jgi:hypothetical protein
MPGVTDPREAVWDAVHEALPADEVWPRPMPSTDDEALPRVDATLINLPVAGNDGLEVVDRAIDAAVIALMVNLAPVVRASLDVVPGRRADCRYACIAWRRELESRAVEVRIEGGVGEDDEAYTARRQLVPLDQRSGYREGDGRVHRHWWLRVGLGAWLFDPTGHQFDDKGGVDRARYVVDGAVLP